ncbi:intraflagellar transport protein Oseg1 [Brevipalpus obovatus]|uniref:intraflagellar transport protein Oseg1 n=1 Tax=Brevipalpus obovatus TaxID=246614 RepID=UPI003D9FAB5A
MKSNIIWRDTFHDRDGNPLSLYDVAFSPDGNHVAATAGTNVYIYNARDGLLVTSLKNHRDTVLSVAYSQDNRRFASGSVDKQVIIWTSKYEGILKYSHNDSIRCLEFNPVSGQLASCTNNDFGIWSPEQKSVVKHKISSQINCCSWSNDGHHLALGTSSGFISIRSMAGDELIRIEKQGGSSPPIWGVCFCPKKDLETPDVIAAADWSQSLNFFDLSGKQVSPEKSLGYDPLSVKYFPNGDYLIITGVNREATMYTREGIPVGTIYKDVHWIWTAKCAPDGTHAVVTQNGNLIVCELTFSTVHSLFKDRYAYRDNMDDVIVQHLLTEEKVRIKCRELVKKLAIYKNRLAIQLATRVVIYELTDGDQTNDMKYKVKEKISQKFECTSMVVSSESLILCQDRKLQCFTFKGTLEREWILEQLIRYLKIIGGPTGREQILVGLKNGQILQIFINNPFPVAVVKIQNSVRCLDVSMSRKKIAVVDEKSNLYVHDLQSKELLYQERNANSVAWNSKAEDMMCFSGMGNLSIRASNFPAHHQQLQGFVVGFSGPKVFCLHFNSMLIVEVSQSVPMYQYLECKLFQEAYHTACLKVTDYDWEQLAHSALESIELSIAKKAFTRTRNYLYLDLIQNYSAPSALSSKNSEMLFLGDVMAFRGRFTEATKFYKQAGHDDKAITMYTDLRMFEQAQHLVKSGDDPLKRKLISQQADWVSNIASHDTGAAAEMYLSAGETSKAIEIYSQNGWVDKLATLSRQLDKGDQKNLALCAQYLQKMKQFFIAADIYKKMGDYKNLALVYVKSHQWEEAFKIAQEYPELRESIYLPYATWLAENDRFIEAQKAFHQAGEIPKSLQVLNRLTSNAIDEHRYSDASYFCWILSSQCLELIDSVDKSDRIKLVNKFEHFQKRADIYYAYHNIYRYIEEPFTSFFPDALFNMARFLCHELEDEDVPGVSKVCVLSAFAKQAKNLGAFKLARTIHDILNKFNIPPRFQEAIEFGDVSARGRPFNDHEDLLPLCYRCSTINPLYNSDGNRCKNCKQPFTFSFTNFDSLPLVEFKLDEGLKEDDAIRIINIEQESRILSAKKKKNSSDWKEENSSEYQVLRLNDDEDLTINSEDQNDEKSPPDPFTERMSMLEEIDSEYEPITVDQEILKQLRPKEVLIVRWPKPLRTQFFRNLMPDISITMCENCLRFFHADELELQMLQLRKCPFCRSSKESATL